MAVTSFVLKGKFHIKAGWISASAFSTTNPLAIAIYCPTCSALAAAPSPRQNVSKRAAIRLFAFVLRYNLHRWVSPSLSELLVQAPSNVSPEAIQEAILPAYARRYETIHEA